MGGSLYTAIVGYNWAAAPNDNYSIVRLVRLGGRIRGYDSFRGLEDYYTKTYYTLETGEIDFGEEGSKLNVREVWVRTHTNRHKVAPMLLLQVMDQHGQYWRDWHTSSSPADDSYFTVTTTSCTSTNIVVSHVIGYGDGVTTDFTVPCKTLKLHTILGSGQEFPYGIISDSQIRFTPAPPLGCKMEAYWNGSPVVQDGWNNVVETSEGFHFIRGFNLYNSLELDRYPSSTEKGYLRTGMQLESGEGKTTIIPINTMLYSPKFRFIIIPRDSTVSTQEVRITGVHFIVDSKDAM